MTQEPERTRRILAEFRDRFGTHAATVVRAPGRVNLLGEHTDYNEGYVLPIAIDRSVLVAAKPRQDLIVNLYSANYRRAISFTLGEAGARAGSGGGGDRFKSYVRGVGECLREQGYALQGMDAVVEGNVPIGAGLSSSAALEMAVLLAFESTSALSLPSIEKARIGQRVENEFIGVQSGIMDQLVSVLAQTGCAVLIDCRTLAHDLVPIESGTTCIVVCDSGVKRSLANSEYNRRREECQEGIRILSQIVPGIASLRDIPAVDLDTLLAGLPDLPQRRCRHVVSENERVLEGVVALRRRDLSRFGELMYQSHFSLRDLYHVSCPELDVLVEAASRVEGVLGSRMTGAGFGGCTVSLVQAETMGRFSSDMKRIYRESTGRALRMWVCEPADGAGTVLATGHDQETGHDRG